MYKYLNIWLIFALIVAFSVRAQTFSADALRSPEKVTSAINFDSVRKNIENKENTETLVKDETMDDIARAFEETKNNVREVKEQVNTDDPLAQISKALASSKEVVDELDDTTEGEKEEEIFIPEGELYKLNSPTLDGSVRGGQAFVEVDDKGRMKKVTKIFLFYDNFKITNYLSGMVSCDVRFNILSNLDQKINQLDVKLVWPGLTTTLSYSNVQPNTQTYYNYSLLGEGCYNMDKSPNIIVNRCRVKGMTASECANKLIWLSK